MQTSYRRIGVILGGLTAVTLVLFATIHNGVLNVPTASAVDELCPLEGDLGEEFDENLSALETAIEDAEDSKDDLQAHLALFESLGYAEESAAATLDNLIGGNQSSFNAALAAYDSVLDDLDDAESELTGLVSAYEAGEASVSSALDELGLDPFTLQSLCEEPQN